MSTERSLSRMAVNSLSLSRARSSVDAGFSRAWMKFMATYMPQSEPIGLKHCARFSLRVAVCSEPIDRTYGLHDVSRNDSPHVRMK